MRRAGHEPPPMPAYKESDKDAAKLRKKIERLEAEQRKAEASGNTALAAKIEKDIRRTRNKYAKRNSITRTLGKNTVYDDEQKMAKKEFKEARDDAATYKALAEDLRKKSTDMSLSPADRKEAGKAAKEFEKLAKKEKKRLSRLAMILAHGWVKSFIPIHEKIIM